MSKFLKEGWHPKGKDGGKESWRGDFKGINQVVSSNLAPRHLFSTISETELLMSRRIE